MTALSQLSIPESIWLYANPIDRLRPELRRLQFIFRPRSQRHARTHELAARVETLVAARLRWLGYTVEMTSHKCPYDALLNGRIRVEIKGARWDGRRYGVRIHNHDTDFLVLFIVGKHPAFYVIPADELAGIRYLKITSQDPAAYRGRWARYREAWQSLTARLEVR